MLSSEEDKKKYMFILLFQNGDNLQADATAEAQRDTEGVSAVLWLFGLEKCGVEQTTVFYR